MKTIVELKKAISEGKTLVWNDPDPIPGNDYTITYIEEIDDEWFDDYDPILIQCGENSEAQVYLHEILVK